MAATPESFEHSPATSLADSFVSTPGSMYPLFPPTMDPNAVLSPESLDEDEKLFEESGTPSPEKKPVKKRKSWGQQLPEPKTNLPPRKRAKTEDEKEQRRVERVLRNRRAAQSSRERKRLEVEALESEKRRVERLNRELEMRLAHMEAQNMMMAQQIHQLTGKMPMVPQSTSSVTTPAQATPVTLSQELFASSDRLPIIKTEMDSDINLQSSIRSQTVNPASLSPEMRPATDLSTVTASDETRHPAAMLCDLQCPSQAVPWKSSMTSSSYLMMSLWLAMVSATTSTLLDPLMKISYSLRTRSSLSSTPSVLNLIIWLVTTPASLTASTSTTTSTHTTTSRSHLKFSLRISLLRRLLACSPNLARPLTDATVAALRLAVEQQLSSDCLTGVGASGQRARESSPTKEALMTLLWSIKVIQREQQQSKESNLDLDVTSEIRQASGELDKLFGQRRVIAHPSTKGMSLTSEKKKVN